MMSTAVIGCGNHHVLWLEESSHYIQYGCLPDRSCLLLRAQGRVARHQEVETRSRDQWRYQANQVVVHVGGVAKRGCAHRHNCGDQAVNLREGRVRNMKPIRSNSIQGCVVENNNTVSTLGQPLEGQKRVVRLNHDVTSKKFSL
jgi:hypothetical protein